MAALVVGLFAGAVFGVLYLIGKHQQVRRTLLSSVLLGILVGILVELARRPFFSAVFAGVATLFLAESIRWVATRTRRR